MEPNYDKVYGFTYMDRITPTGELTKCVPYVTVLSRLEKYGTVIHHTFEQSKKGRTHLHGMIQFRRTPKLTTLCYKGFSVRWEKIWNRSGWMSYITKGEQFNRYIPVME